VDPNAIALTCLLRLIAPTTVSSSLSDCTLSDVKSEVFDLHEFFLGSLVTTELI
jgi:hypothetical protein